jgi:acyl-CoA reductase-like NAD-dependent aldehyde dehydrogenase
MSVTAVAAVRVMNPATGALCAEVPAHAPADLAAVMARARRDQPAWAALPFAERARALRRFARRLLDDRELLPILCGESGKPRFEAEAIELFYTCELTRYFTGRAGRRTLRDEVRRPLIFANKRARLIYHPRGVVGVIGPWNWPLLNNYADAIAPLVCGNAVVLKPSPLTPLTSLHVARLWNDEGLPEGVLQVLVGGAEVGEALVAQADMIFFTGSNAAGRAVARAAGDRLIPCVLELGGKSPMVVLADADLPRAARAAVWSAFAHSGQVCIRTERVIVEAPAAEELARLIALQMGRLRQGGPGTAAAGAAVDVDVGAMTYPPQVERIEGQIADAVAGGARVVVGGKRRADLPGTFFEPTLLVDVTPEMAVAREETFGPLLPIIRAASADQAMALANASPLGLSGSVWSGDARKAAALARRLEAGSVCVNDTLVNYFCVEAPLGGTKGSGLGLRHGPEALRQFCWVETVVEDRAILGLLSPFIDAQLSFPYKTRVLRLLRWLMRRIY